MRALITGVTGQDGRYLAELLLSKGYTVFGLVRGGCDVPGVTPVRGDLTDLASLVRALDVAQPTELYNLGSQSSVSRSWEDARLTTTVTALGVLNVLEAVRLHCPEDDPAAVRVYQASSSEMYGKVQRVPQDERTALWPRSPYGVAKAYGHHLTINYRESYGMHASSGILFNHESPRRGPEFVTRKVSLAVARIALGQQQTLTMGNLDARRDWGYAGDFVDAMHRMLQQDVADDYVIATGETHSVRELLDTAFAHVGIDDWTEHVEVDKRFLRPAEIEESVGDASRARSVLGWAPTVGFADLVAMMVDADLALVRRG